MTGLSHMLQYKTQRREGKPAWCGFLDLKAELGRWLSPYSSCPAKEFLNLVPRTYVKGGRDR